jgi:excisionase family DNA binding protein
MAAPPSATGKANIMINEERFLKLKDVQDRFAVSRATVWRWQAERGLRVVCVGGVTRIRESDLQEFIEKHLKAAEN